MRLVERLCDVLLARFPRIHMLINNAAQTLTRAPGWFARALQLELQASDTLPPMARALVRPASMLLGACVPPCVPPPPGNAQRLISESGGGEAAALEVEDGEATGRATAATNVLPPTQLNHSNIE